MRTVVIPVEVDHIAALYQRYRAELLALSVQMNLQYHLMLSRGYTAFFTDLEGELLYLLIRETKPETIFEIAPNAGWSTNYILAALTKNNNGHLHSFEIMESINGKKTDIVIRDNQHKDLDLSRLTIHIGDARETTAGVAGGIDLLFLDGSHSSEVAKWYIETLLPRVEGPIFIHDIASSEGFERSTEAEYVSRWAQENDIALNLIGQHESRIKQANIRAGLTERCGMLSVGTFFVWPPTFSSKTFYHFEPSPDERIASARNALQKGDKRTAEELLSQAVTAGIQNPLRGDVHLVLCDAGNCYGEIGMCGERDRCFQRAVAIALLSDILIRFRALVDLLQRFLSAHQWHFAAKTLYLTGMERRAFRPCLRMLAGKVKGFILRL